MRQEAYAIRSRRSKNTKSGRDFRKEKVIKTLNLDPSRSEKVYYRKKGHEEQGWSTLLKYIKIIRYTQ